MKILLIILFSFIFNQEECQNGRYENEIFDVDVEYEVQYGQNINETLFGSQYTENLYMDIYSPREDDFNDRPLIFFLFGGSFVGGSKSNGDIVDLCTKYAKRGYIAVAIDYRLSQNLLFFNPNEENAYKAVLKAIHDLKAAIRYFRMDNQYNNQFKIDSNRIYAGGVSAGAIAVVNAAYLNEESEIPSFLLDDIDDLGGFEGLSGNLGYDSSFYGIVNLCGAIGDRNWIIADDIPIVSMHGNQDDTIPYDDNLVTLFGLDMQVDGSYIIHQTMLGFDNYSDLYTYENQGHTPFSSNMNLETEFTSSFLYEIVCSSDLISGDLNQDESLNILDIIELVNLILLNQYNELGDMNQDNYLNVVDIVLLVNIILSN